MNEEKLLELLKDLVGGDRAFQWVGEQMGKGSTRVMIRPTKPHTL